MVGRMMGMRLDIFATWMSAPDRQQNVHTFVESHSRLSWEKRTFATFCQHRISTEIEDILQPAEPPQLTRYPASSRRFARSTLQLKLQPYASPTAETLLQPHLRQSAPRRFPSLTYYPSMPEIRRLVNVRRDDVRSEIKGEKGDE